MAELPRGVRGHTYTVMITIFFLGGGEAGHFGGELLPLKYPRYNSVSQKPFFVPYFAQFSTKDKSN